MTQHTKLRLGNVEILRIIAIFLIALHHYSLHNHWWYPDGFSKFKVAVFLMQSGGKIGVSIFILITGFFMIQKKFKWQSIFRVLIETQLVSLSILVLQLIFHIGYPVSTIQVFARFFPLFFNQYWFITIYVLLYLCIPILNPFLHSLTKRQYRMTIVIIFFITTIWPSFIFLQGINNFKLGTFILLYMVGGYLSRFKEDTLALKRLKVALMFFVIYAVHASLHIVLAVLLESLPIRELFGNLGFPFSNNSFYFAQSDQSPFSVILATLLVIFFINTKIPPNKFLTLAGQGTFVVYLIQSAPNLGGSYLWNDVFKGYQFNGQYAAVVYGIFVAAAVVIFGILVSLVVLPVEKLIQKKTENIIRLVITKFTSNYGI